MKPLLIALLGCLLALPASAHEGEQTTEQCEESITVFQDVSMIGRKDRLASNITKKHREMSEQGWRFVDMEIYVENADMEGAFLTYSRSVPCPENP